MDVKEALKRLKQETIPATYNPDFDKNECIDAIEKVFEDAVIIPKATLQRWFELLCVNGCNSKGMVRNDIQEVLKK